MSKVAFFVDGNFMFHQLKQFKSFFCDGPNILNYCLRHLNKGEAIYRIFFYDTPPLERIVPTPSGSPMNYGATQSSKNMKARLESIRETPHLALRLGKISCQDEWILKPNVLKELLNGTRAVTSLIDGDYYLDIKQKAVDMKIGLDIATITYKRLADRIVLIAGDADFTPAAKLARMEGMEVTLDPMGKKVPADLLEHIDYIHTPLDPNNASDVDPKKKIFFVPPRKALYGYFNTS